MGGVGTVTHVPEDGEVVALLRVGEVIARLGSGVLVVGAAVRGGLEEITTGVGEEQVALAGNDGVGLLASGGVDDELRGLQLEGVGLGNENGGAGLETIVVTNPKGVLGKGEGKGEKKRKKKKDRFHLGRFWEGFFGTLSP